MIAPLALVLTVGWLLLVVSAPILPLPMAAALYGLGSRICHQIADRSFHLFGSQLPVCARCTGIYAGAAIAALATVIRMDAHGRSAGRQDLPLGRARRLLVAGAAPTAITVALEGLGLWRPSNIVRAMAGVPLGFAVAFMVTGAVATLHYERCAPRPPIAPNPQPPRI